MISKNQFREITNHDAFVISQIRISDTYITTSSGKFIKYEIDLMISIKHLRHHKIIFDMEKKLICDITK